MENSCNKTETFRMTSDQARKDTDTSRIGRALGESASLFSTHLIQARVIWEGRASTEKSHSTRLAHGQAYGIFFFFWLMINVGKSSSLGGGILRLVVLGAI